MVKNEKGFSAVEGLLVAIVVLLIGFIGYYVWNSNHKSDTKEESSNSAATVTKTIPAKTELTQTTPVDSTKYLTVTEWGIKIPIGTSTSGLSYEISSPYYKDQGSLGSFSSNDLKAVSTADCHANVVTVAFGNKDQFVPQEAGISTTSYETQYNKTKSNDSYLIGVKIGENYIVNPNFAGASCTTTNENLAKETQAVEAIRAAIRKAVVN